MKKIVCPIFIMINVFFGVCYGGHYLVHSIEGAAFCGDKLLKANDKIDLDCQINTHARSNVFLKAEGNLLAFGENVKGVIKGVDDIMLNSGMLRVTNGAPLKVLTPLGSIYLKQGVYLTKLGTFLNEVEVITFSGEAKFSSSVKENDFVHILPGHWGGVGGRFGSKIGNLLKLNSEQTKVFKIILN